MNSKLIILFFCILFATFQALYFRQISLAPFPLLSFFMLFFVNFKSSISLEEIKFIIIFLLIFLVSIIVGIINADYLSGYTFYLPRALGWLLFPLSVIYFRKAFKRFNLDEIDKIVKVVLIFHLSLFFLQFILFTFFNYKIDYLYSITGEMQRTGAAGLKSFSSSIRASGLFTEPGSYSVYIYILVVMRFLLIRKIDIYMLVGIISMILSYSITGILMAAFIILYYLFLDSYSVSKLKNGIFLFCGLTLVLYFKAEIFLGPIYNRLYNIDEDTSAEARFQGDFDYFVQNGYYYSGLGIGTMSENVTGTSVILGGLFDLGMILLTLFILIKFIYLIKWTKNLKYAVLLLPVFMSNISFNQIIYTAFLGFLMSLTPKFFER